MSDQDRIVILLSRRLAGELSPAEEEELRLALEHDPLLEALSATLDEVKDAPPMGVTEQEERQMMERGLRRWRLRAAGLHEVSAVRGGGARGPVEGSGVEGGAVSGSAVEGSAVKGGARQEATVTMEEPGGRRMFRIRPVRWSAAAAVIVLGTLGVYRYNRAPPPPQAPVEWHEVAAKYGTRSYLELPDGSKLWLNAGSKVRYATGARELTLSGEAFFDVKHDPGQPFLIHAGGVDVKVLGTSLNVRAYPEDSTVETTLIQGKAEIELSGQAIVLRPSEKVTMRHNVPASGVVAGDDAAGGGVVGSGNAASGGAASGGGTAQQGKADNATTGDKGKEARPIYERHSVVADPTFKTIIETSWVEDKLVFRKEPFRQVAAKLERWYNIRFHFQNGKYLEEELTGYFKDQPIKNVMDGLQLSLGFHYEIAGDSILIK